MRNRSLHEFEALLSRPLLFAGSGTMSARAACAAPKAPSYFAAVLGHQLDLFARAHAEPGLRLQLFEMNCDGGDVSLCFEDRDGGGRKGTRHCSYALILHHRSPAQQADSTDKMVKVDVWIA